MRNVFPYLTLAAALALAGCGGMQDLGSGASLGNLTQAGGSAMKAFTLSDGDIQKLSNESCAQNDAQAKVAGADDKYTRRLAKVMQRMPTTVAGQPIGYKVYLTGDVNAWAMANGCVRVYSGLMDLMNDDELRAVLGHEEGHVALGHSKKAMQVAYAAVAARQAVGAAGGAAAALSQSQLGDLSEKLVNAQFSQAQENDADDYAFDLLTRQELPRRGLVTAFEKLGKLDNGQTSMFSSHPSSADRAANMQMRINGGRKK